MRRERRSRHDGEFVNSRGRAKATRRTWVKAIKVRMRGSDAAQSSSFIDNCFSSRFPNWIPFTSLCLFHEPPAPRCRQTWNDPHQSELPAHLTQLWRAVGRLLLSSAQQDEHNKPSFMRRDSQSSTSVLNVSHSLVEYIHSRVMTHEAGGSLQSWFQTEVHNTGETWRAMWYLKHTNTLTHNMVKRHLRQRYIPSPKWMELNVDVYIKGANHLSADIHC